MRMVVVVVLVVVVEVYGEKVKQLRDAMKLRPVFSVS